MKKKWSERADFAESCFSKLKTNKEKYAVALAFQYGPKVVFGGGGDEQSTKEDETKWFKAQFGMFTYFSPKWKIQRKPWGSFDNIERFQTLCAEDPYVLKQWEAIDEEIMAKVAWLHVNKWAYSFELCPEQFKEGTLQLHLTVVFLFGRKMGMRTSKWMELTGGLKPQHVKDPSSGGRGRRANSPNPMFYYVQMPKVGMVMHEGNWKPYKDFQVNDRWLIPFLQAKKISLKDASQDFFYLPVGSPKQTTT